MKTALQKERGSVLYVKGDRETFKAMAVMCTIELAREKRRGIMVLPATRMVHQARECDRAVFMRRDNDLPSNCPPSVVFCEERGTMTIERDVEVIRRCDEMLVDAGSGSAEEMAAVSEFWRSLYPVKDKKVLKGIMGHIEDVAKCGLRRVRVREYLTEGVIGALERKGYKVEEEVISW
jgi:hypothetical protein